MTRRLAVLLMSSSLLAVAAPQRIISTAPAITEILFALGLGDRVVGVTTYCLYPPEAQKVKKIGTWEHPNIEEILALRPDLVIVQKTAVHSRTVFGNIRLNVLEVQNNNFGDIRDAIAKIGAAAGVPERARALVAKIDDRLAAVKQRVADRPQTTMMFIVGRDPGTLQGMVAAGRSSYINDVIELAGGRNIFTDSVAAYPKISHEDILARNPEVIVDLGDLPEAQGETEEHKREVIRLWGSMPALRAVKTHRVYPVSSGMFVVPGPRVTDLAEAFARMLHPELFR